MASGLGSIALPSASPMPSQASTARRASALAKATARSSSEASSGTASTAGSLRVATIRDAGKKSVKTRAGVYDVVGIQHQRQGSSRATTLWCAPELDYLPVLIEQHKNGKLKFSATLTSYTPT